MNTPVIPMPSGDNPPAGVDDEPADIKPGLLVCLKRLAVLQRSRIEALDLQEAVSQMDSSSMSSNALKGELRRMMRRLGASKPIWIKQLDPANVPLLIIDEELGCAARAQE